MFGLRVQSKAFAVVAGAAIAVTGIAGAQATTALPPTARSGC